MKKVLIFTVSIIGILLFMSITAYADVQISDINSGWYWPVHPTITTMTSPYGGWRNNFTNLHQGIDLSGGSNLSIYASRYGDVAFAGYDSSMGYYISIYHGEWNGYKIYSTYMHLAEPAYYTVGTTVEGGQLIGKMGNTGSSDGTHLHFQITKSTGYVSSAYMPHKSDSQLSANFINTNPSQEQINEWGLTVWNLDRFNNSSHPSCTYGTIRYTKVGESVTPPDTEAPANVVLSVNKSLFAAGETVYFSASSQGANGYTIGIYKDGNRVYTADIGSSFEKSFNEPGTYTAYVTAWNSIGLVDSNRISFNVYNSAPNTSKLSINKSVVAVGEEVTFKCEAENAVGYTIGIKNGNESILTQNIDATFKKSFSKPGNYSAYVTAWNAIGILDSNRIYFVVYNSAPSSAELKIDKNTIYTGEKIRFTCVSEEATGYTIGIYKDGVKIFTSDIGSSFEKDFFEAGNYTAYVTAWNSIGLVDSNRVSFTVHNLVPSACKLSINKSVVAVGEEITFNCEAENATGYTIGINNGEERIVTEVIGKTYTKSFSKPGKYSAYVTAWNTNGLSDSNRIYFVVYDSAPSSSELKIDKDTICVGDSIQFTCVPEEATGYTIGIHKDGVRILTQDIGKVFTKSFSDAGVYTAYVTSWNTKGIRDSERITFIVYDSNNALVLKNNNSVRIVNKLNVSCNSYSCIIALYEGKKLVKCINKSDLNGSTTLDETILCTDRFDKIKIMVWDSLFGLTSLCEAEVIPESEFLKE